ncbi:MAG: hypothetical protein H7Z14_04720, partial [Anaerolineae bacterium]|nr:hypothetical protein [Phycisphaerae bacterium]
IRVPSAHNAILNGSTITPGTNFAVPNNARLNLNGTVTNNGSLTITSGAAHSFLSPVSNSSATLTGSGVTRFTSNPGVTNAGIDGQATLTIAAGHTVAGAAYMNNTRVINNGTILADQSGNVSMYLDPYNGNANAIVNNGTLRAAGGTLNLAGDSGGNISGNGPLIADVNGTIQTVNSITGNIGPVSGAGTYRATSSSNLGHQYFRVGTLEAITSGTARVTANGTNTGTSRVSMLSITAGKVDLTDNDMVIDYTAGNTPISTVRGYLQTGYGGGTWNGNGLITSLGTSNKRLGYAEASDVFTSFPATFSGQQVDNTTVLIKYTYAGDADLNGIVDFDDYSRIDAGFNNNRTGWVNGDVDYNNIVDFDDYSLIDQAFNTQSGTLRRAMSYLDGSDRSDKGMDAPGLQLVRAHLQQFGEQYAAGFLNSVPEPSSMLALTAFAFIAPRRSRRSRAR